MHLQGFDHAVEKQADPNRGDKETDDARRCVDPHGSDFLRELLGLGQADMGREHRRYDRRRNGDERRNLPG